MEKVREYIKALIHLYGLVHKDKIVEIYNMQNDHEIDDGTIQAILKEKKQDLLNEAYISVHNDYFVYLSIMIADKFEVELKAKKGKPYYIPEKEELLNYKDITYFEVNQEYEEVLRFLRRMFWRKSKAEDVGREIQRSCRSVRGLELLPLRFEEKKMRFKNAKQADEFMDLVRNLANNTRVWENNGFTPNELAEMMKNE